MFFESFCKLISGTIFSLIILKHTYRIMFFKMFKTLSIKTSTIKGLLNSVAKKTLETNATLLIKFKTTNLQTFPSWHFSTSSCSKMANCWPELLCAQDWRSANQVLWVHFGLCARVFSFVFSQNLFWGSASFAKISTINGRFWSEPNIQGGTWREQLVLSVFETEALGFGEIGFGLGVSDFDINIELTFWEVWWYRTLRKTRSVSV